MRSGFARLLFSLVLLSGRPARAQSEPDAAPAQPSLISVTREEGAESCPDTQALVEHVQRVRGREAVGESSTYHVSFSRRGGVFSAAIRVGSSSSSVRVLRDRGQTCASLEQATALTLALLLDSDAHDLPDEVDETESFAPSPTPPPPRLSAPATAPEPTTPLRFALSFGAAGVLGVVQTAAPATLVDVGLFAHRFHTSLGVLWLPTQKLDLGPGQLQESLFSGVARSCYVPLNGTLVHLALCSGLYVGVTQVEAKGYTRNESVSRTWLAVPLEIALSTSASPIGLELGASALLPLRQSDFAIDHLGVAYESWPVGMLVALRAVGNFPL
jgi:hypothetical protein